ncbi:MAG TPA: Rieske (2Fe-2S) protein [Acidimicrobiales bacterium]|nr:Rieske (2Fe-2S) protein [Acidimicrobiales bacterium]
MTTTRRAFLRNSWKVGGTALLIAAGWTVWESLRPLSGTSGGGPVNLNSPSNYATGTATYVPEGRLYVTNAKGTLFALSQKCPHLGCRVPYRDSSGRFECPCHGSVFDLGGEWITGPAPRGMDRYPLTLVKGNLIADTSKLEPGPNHGATTYLEPPKGPSCKPKG